MGTDIINLIIELFVNFWLNPKLCVNTIQQCKNRN